MATYTANVESVGHYEVVVCGGGSAGFCAAVAAARTGARVALVEQYGMMGGIMTVGGNPKIGLFYAFGKQIIKGVGWELVTRLKEADGAELPDFENERRHPYLNVSVNPFMASLYMDKMCLESGVELYLGYRVAGVIKEADGKIKGAVILSKQGLQMITAVVFVDCTGDGDLCAFAGAEFELGAQDGELQPGTLPFSMVGYHAEEIDEEQVDQSYEAALAAGEVHKHDFWPGKNPISLFVPDPTCANLNNGNHVEYNAHRENVLTMAEIEGKRSVERFINWARKEVKGAEELKVYATPPCVSMREWRRIKCMTQVTCEDYVAGRRYDDSICYSYYPIDLHQTTNAPLLNIYMEENTVPSIPYSAMVVKGFDNLLVAGRCIDSDRLANSALRVKASCMAMGHGAGVAAALASHHRLACKDVGIEEIKSVLREQDAICVMDELK